MASHSKVIVVTGCSEGGIGAHTCEAFHKRGHKVFAASRNLDKMSTLSPGIIRVQLDVNDVDSVREGVKQIIEQAGRIDVLVNNAGQGCVAPLIEVDIKRLRQTFDVNVFGMIQMVQAVTPHMIKARSGTIVNIGSIVGYAPTPWAGVYCASKAAVHSFTDTLRMELQGFGINCMVVAPGAIKSNIGKANDDKVKEALLKDGSVYSNVEEDIRSRGSWSQTQKSTPTDVLAETIVSATLRTFPLWPWNGPPRYLTTGYRSKRMLFTYFLPTFMKEWFWGNIFGITKVGRI